MGKKYQPSLAGKLSGTVQKVFDPYSRGSNQCFPLGKRPNGSQFIPIPEDFYKSLSNIYNSKPSSKQEKPLMYILFLLYITLFLPVLMCFRDSLLGGVYILAALASYYQLQGDGRIVFMSVLGFLFYWWCLTRALWGPNNDILNTLEAINCKSLIELLKMFSIKRCNPFTGLVTRTNYINTTKRSIGFNCSERWNLSMDDNSLETDLLEFPALKIKILFQRHDIVSADIPEDEYGMITVESKDEILTDYNQFLFFRRIQSYFNFISLYPDNLTCSETIGNEMGIPCAYAISLREIMDHFSESSGVYQMKFDKEILVK